MDDRVAQFGARAITWQGSASAQRGALLDFARAAGEWGVIADIESMTDHEMLLRVCWLGCTDLAEAD